MDWLKQRLSDWKVTVALVGGALVVGSMFGTCTFEPGSSDVSEEAQVDAEEVSNTNTVETTTEATENTTTATDNTDNTSEESNNTETTNTETTETE
tara:strand:+ start:61 stop:348 length:288 start_codon:yes stop_codon:yes gene_type:complete